VPLLGMHLRDPRVQQHDNGTQTIRPPERQHEQGRVWPAYVLQPGIREAVEPKNRRLCGQSAA
jgi:hypothetical protein